MDANEIATKADILRLESLLTELLKSQKSTQSDFSDNDYYTADEVCRVLNISKATLYTWKSKGKISFHKIVHKTGKSKKSFYKKSEIDAMIKDNIDFGWIQNTIRNLVTEIENLRKRASIGKSLMQEFYSEEDVMKILGIKKLKTLHNLTYKGVLSFQKQEGLRGKIMLKEDLEKIIYTNKFNRR